VRRASAALALVVLAACGGEDEAGEALTDGRWFGQVESIDAAGGRLAFDLAELDGDVVQDAEDATVDVPVADDVEVALLDPCCEPSSASFAEWLDGFEADDRSYFTTSRSYYWLTVEGGEVVAVEEHHLEQTG